MTTKQTCWIGATSLLLPLLLLLFLLLLLLLFLLLLLLSLLSLLQADGLRINTWHSVSSAY